MAFVDSPKRLDYDLSMPLDGGEEAVGAQARRQPARAVEAVNCASAPAAGIRRSMMAKHDPAATGQPAPPPGINPQMQAEPAPGQGPRRRVQHAGNAVLQVLSAMGINPAKPL